jgi:hypothetical protein
VRHSPAIILALLALVTLGGSSALAQDVGPEESARFRFGPIRFTPGIEIRNVGVDTNIFNDAEDPKQDFVASFGPAADYWFRAGRARLSGRTGLQYDYFKDYATQRAFGTVNRARLEIVGNRVTPFVEGVYDNTRRRPSFEIDARARYRTDGITPGLDVRLLSRTVLRFEAERGHVEYEQGQEFNGVDLGAALNRETTAYRGSVRHALTPLTTFVVTGEERRDRFDISPGKDADGFRVLPGFDIKPGALISGRAAVGYASFRTLDPNVPDFHGLVAAAELHYTVRASRVGLQLVRDPTYSYETTEPYYVYTNLLVQLTQRVTTNWDFMARGGRQWLAYRQFLSEGPSDRDDSGWRLGAGTGRWLGQTLRVGFDVDYLTRSSPIPSRNYDGWRAGANIVYGLQSQ